MRPGAIVTLRDELWTVAQAESFEQCTLLTLEGRGPDNAGRVFRALTPFDRLTTSRDTRPLRRKRRAVLRCALNAIARERPALGLWTAAGASLDLLAYQLEPALAVLRGATRVLLADAVGLGKTVQAGFILAELRSRGLAERALVLCPAGLRHAWAGELQDRFGIHAAVLDQASIALGLPELPAGVNPWAAHPVVVASIDFVKRPEVLAAVEEVPFDLVIADEAHHLTPASDRGAAIDRLGARAPWLVLVSATPHSGDQAAFEYLTAIGTLSDRLAVFRRSRRDVGVPDQRRVQRLSVRPTPDETRLLRATDDYARAIWQARGRTERAVQLVAITLARRAASSAAALERTLSRRLALLSGAAPAVPVQGWLPLDDVDDSDGDEPDDRLVQPGLPDEDAERRRLADLLDLARAASAQSSKLGVLRRLLDRAGEPAVVFTEYRDTLHAASAQLGSRYRLGVIHGGVPAPMRQEVVRQFERGDVDVLVATDTAGEGLNLHRRCRLVIDLELPWNPRRIEQRVGRVDRIGQPRRVHAVHLVHRGTVEDAVWSRLEGRRRRAAQALGDEEAPTDGDIARAVFDAAALPHGGGAHVPSARVEAAGDELRRVTEQRRLRRLVRATAFDRAIFSSPRRARHGHIAAGALYECSRQSRTGGMIERRVQAVVLALRHMDRHEAWLGLAIAAASSGTAVGPDAHLQPMRQAVIARIAAARARLASSQPLAHQGSLFDRRAERAAGARREVAARLDAALARRATSLDPVEGRASHVRLIALWPLRGEP